MSLDVGVRSEGLKKRNKTKPTCCIHSESLPVDVRGWDWDPGETVLFKAVGLVYYPDPVSGIRIKDPHPKPQPGFYTLEVRNDKARKSLVAALFIDLNILINSSCPF